LKGDGQSINRSNENPFYEDPCHSTYERGDDKGIPKISKPVSQLEGKEGSQHKKGPMSEI
jgi:hypothetical protein